jgi:TetR/AcrR family transcriptional regulator, ethionamide resistance regulator
MLPTARQRDFDPGSDFDFGLVLGREAAGKRKRDRTRAAIQQAACTILDRAPLASLTVAEICRVAGVAHGTFYIYYPDRHALLADVLKRFVDYVQRAMRGASQAAPEGSARAATAAYYRLFERNRGVMKCLVNHLDQFPETRDAFQALNRKWIETVVAAAERKLARSSRAGAVPRDELMRRAYALGGMVDQYLGGLFLSEDPTLVSVSKDADAVIDTLSFIWQRGMGV